MPYVSTSPFLADNVPELTFNAQEPPLSPGARAVVRSYGGWTNFMLSMGLKPWKDDDAEEGKAIAEAFAQDQQ
jgi:hypothetical protein